MEFYILRNENIPRGYLFVVKNKKIHEASIRQGNFADEFGCELQIDNDGHDLNDDEDLLKQLKEIRNKRSRVFDFDDWKYEKLELQPGDRYSRIYRPILSVSDPWNELGLWKEPFEDYKVTIRGLNQLITLLDLLDDILKVVHPEPANLKVYGSQIKNLLILSCIEVEAQMKGILKANGYKNRINKKGDEILLNRLDYIKLRDVLKLDKYEVFFLRYLELESFKPFSPWNKPSDPRWYTAYNSVKHDTEGKFKDAILKNAINSICAVAILLKAQYGESIPFWKEKFESHFSIQHEIEWNHTEKLIPPLQGNQWKKRNYDFK